MYASGKNGLGRDWHVQDFKTGKTLIRATSVYLMMDKKTRKTWTKLIKFEQPGWTDMDVNQHLSHIKHVNYALELQRIMSFLC
ncbi:hypothetical protein ACOSQ2_021008 [Xanthoceras sorbifolium]